MHPADEKIIRTCVQLKCYLCDAQGVPLYQDLKDILFGVPGNWTLSKCSNQKCGLTWLSPMPNREDIGLAYQRYYTHVAGNPKVMMVSIRKTLDNSVLRKVFGYGGSNYPWIYNFFDFLVSMMPFLKDNVGGDIAFVEHLENGRLLDVGCGNGHYLKKMSELGWDVVGVEPDEQAGRFAQLEFGLSVIIGTLEAAGLPSDSFDVITLNHVIEHVHDHLPLLAECKRVLKPGGKIVILSPNIDSLGCRYFKGSWRGLEPPRHLYLFTQQALQKCSEKVGLNVLKSRTITRAARGMWVVSKNIRSNGKHAINYITWPLRVEGMIFRVIEEILCLLGMNAGEENLIILAKNNATNGDV